MSTELTQAQDHVALPAHIKAALESGEIKEDIAARNNVNQLTFRGKVWRAVVDGKEHIQTNDDGDPVSTIRVVILTKDTARSRAYYEGAYKEGENRMPTCYSQDGVTPDADVKEPCSTTCASCPMSAKGSRVNDSGQAGIACSSFKNIVVIPSNDFKFPALRLRLPQTSIWDKDTEGEEWQGFEQYVQKLRSKGVVNLATLVTKIKFDTDKAYPKLLFCEDLDHHPKYKAYLDEQEFSTLLPRLKEDFNVLLGKTSAAPKALAAPAQAGGDAKPRTPVAQLDNEPAKTEAKASKPKAEPKEEASAPATGGTPDGLKALVDDWDD